MSSAGQEDLLGLIHGALQTFMGLLLQVSKIELKQPWVPVPLGFYFKFVVSLAVLLCPQGPQFSSVTLW